MIAIQGDNDISGRLRESALIGSPISAVQFGNDDRAHLPGDCGRPVGRAIVNDNDFIDKWRQFPKHLSNPDLLIEAGNDYGDAPVLIHVSRRARRLFSAGHWGGDRYNWFVLRWEYPRSDIPAREFRWDAA